MQFDGVVCTDVLEHFPEDDLTWIVEETVRFRATGSSMPTWLAIRR